MLLAVKAFAVTGFAAALTSLHILRARSIPESGGLENIARKVFEKIESMSGN